MLSSSDENVFYLQRRLPAAIIFILAFFLIVMARLFYLQIKKGDEYQKLADEIFIREEEVVAKRGDILDRNNFVLASTRPYYEIVMTPQYVLDEEKVFSSLTKILPLKREEIFARLKAAENEARFFPVAIAEDVPYDWVARLSEHLSPSTQDQHSNNLAGVAVRAQALRIYLYPEIFSHALGYLVEIDRAALLKAKETAPLVYSPGDLMGAAAVEKYYDREIKGVDGAIGRVVDAQGREVAKNEDLRVLQEKATIPAQPGFALKTTLDFAAQQRASELLQGKKASVVALDPNNGEVIVLYSSPGFDANRLMKNLDRAYWQKLNLDEDKYLFNRAIQAAYPPASTYKVVVLTAALAEGIVDVDKTQHTCHGGLNFGNRFFRCWRAGGHGRVGVLQGLAQSCDVFFYQVGRAVGVDKIAEYAQIFGLNQKTGIDLPFEKAGLIPTRAWKEKVKKQEWIESETLSVAIGQSYNLVTPLQNALVAAFVANGGYRVVPHLMKEFLSDGKVEKSFAVAKIPTSLVGSQAIAIVKQGMTAVVHGEGTARRLRQSPNKIAGKTGTAQIVSSGSKVRAGVNTENHAWFIAFAPYDAPKIAVSVIVEHGGGGSATAAPIAMEIIDTYLNNIEFRQASSKSDLWK